MNIPTKYEPYEGTIFNTDAYGLSRQSIFISIISYRDPFVVNTIQSLIKNAKRKDNIFISVVIAEVQADNHEWVQEAIKIYEDNKNNIELSVEELTGKTTYGQLKKIADSKYNKQSYYMSVSSRSEFDPHWDSLLIKQYHDLIKNLGENVIITCEPRRYLPHDDVVKGFVYFTNHKIKKSFQREEYDGSRIPISGYSEFSNDENMSFDLANESFGSDIFESVFQVNDARVNEQFLSKFGFPKFSSRKFVKDEYISLASGVSDKFIFSDGKKYIKHNQSNSTLIDRDQYNFYSFVNFVRNNFKIVSIRFTPVYQLYQDGSPLIYEEKTTYDLYTDDEYKNSTGMEEIDRLIRNYVYDNKEINMLLSIDWEEKKFKSRKILINDSFISAVNSFISLYNFSIYENSLHWNKKC